VNITFTNVGDDTCFNVGNAGRCGVGCPVYVRGDCGEPQEINSQDVIDEYGEEEGAQILESYGHGFNLGGGRYE